MYLSGKLSGTANVERMKTNCFDTWCCELDTCAKGPWRLGIQLILWYYSTSVPRSYNCQWVYDCNCMIQNITIIWYLLIISDNKVSYFNTKCQHTLCINCELLKVHELNTTSINKYVSQNMHQYTHLYLYFRFWEKRLIFFICLLCLYKYLYKSRKVVENA